MENHEEGLPGRGVMGTEERDHGGVVNYHPWRRYFARTIDLFFISLVFVVVFLFIGSIFFPQSAVNILETLGNPLISGVIVYLFWVPIEAFFLSSRGATPGKWIFGIRVLTGTGQHLTYSEALQRAFLVWIRGDGVGIPLIAIFTRLFAYKRLKRSGSTSWDNAIGSVVNHAEFGPVRTVACVIAVSVAMGVSTIVSLMGNAGG